MSSYLDEGQRQGILGWILSTDHKRIGVLYLASMLILFFVAVTIGVLMRIEQLTLDPPLFAPQVYNAFFTVHGVIMIFMFVLPGLPAVFGNFFLPIMIGAKDVSFPAAEPAVVVFLHRRRSHCRFFAFYGEWAAGYRVDLLRSLQPEKQHQCNAGSTGRFCSRFFFHPDRTELYHHDTRLRAPGMTWHRMPLFAWSLYGTAWIQLLATPIIGITLLLIIAERLFGIGVFDPAKGGDPLLYQHLFWIYSHPAVYIMILPAMGAISEIIPTFAHKIDLRL